MIQDNLLRDKTGATIVEFAIVAPIFLLFAFGIFRSGQLFFVNADLENAVAYSARVASVYPLPEDERIREAFWGRAAHLDKSRLSGPEVTHSTNAEGQEITEIEVEYRQPLDFIFFSLPDVTLTERQRVYSQPKLDEAAY